MLFIGHGMLFGLYARAYHFAFNAPQTNSFSMWNLIAIV